MDWTDRLHRSLISVADLVNRHDIDARIIAASGVKLDRALFPLLARVAIRPEINVAELANVVGRDHSTVSRQIVKLEQLGLIDRNVDPADSRARRLRLSPDGKAMMAKIEPIRRQWIQDHFRDWSTTERDRLVHLLEEMVSGIDRRTLQTE